MTQMCSIPLYNSSVMCICVVGANAGALASSSKFTSNAPLVGIVILWEL